MDEKTSDVPGLACNETCFGVRAAAYLALLETIVLDPLLGVCRIVHNGLGVEDSEVKNRFSPQSELSSG